MTIYRLEPGIQHYAWGSTAFIPELLGVDNADGRPYAELWLGAHPDLPSKVLLEDEKRLLGEMISGELPFLMKILSAAKPLSIQTHPSASRAREGFARENAAGIPIDARHRSYRDPHHKPELLCALTDFYALRGFRPDPTPFGDEPLKTLYAKLMTMSRDEVDAELGPIVESLGDGHYGKEDREYWVLRCHEEYSEKGHYDRGLFSIYLLNLIHLEPGEAIYLDAGTLHAYLEGSGVEIMANSNNVLRGGLTKKHVDIPELLNNVVFRAEAAQILRASKLGPSEWAYRAAAKEFELRRIEGGHVNSRDHGPEILFVAEGEGTVEDHLVSRGQALFVPEGETYHVQGTLTLYKATVPR